MIDHYNEYRKEYLYEKACDETIEPSERAKYMEEYRKLVKQEKPVELMEYLSE